jgi:hypothetical protein
MTLLFFPVPTNEHPSKGRTDGHKGGESTLRNWKDAKGGNVSLSG